MESYWSVEDCAWVEHSSAVDPEPAVGAPEQRVPEDEPVTTS
ncbi:MAG: hypothetical protein JWO22_1205 [Frankiales bacterium]|nr:hypothetical protein [Frankiales bacterium]